MQSNLETKKMELKRIYILLIITAILGLSATDIVAQFKIVPSIGVGSQAMNFKSDHYTVSGLSGINFGGDVYFYIGEDMAIGGGIRLAEYGAKSTLSSYNFSEARTDIDGDSYLLTADFTNVDEEYKLSVLEIPILFKYEKWLSTSLTLSASGGPVILMPGKIKGSFESGSVETSGYYSEWNLTINDLPEYGFYNRELTGSMDDIAAKTSFGILFEAGAEYFLTKRIYLTLSAYYQSSLGSVFEGNVSNQFLSNPALVEGSILNAPDVKLSRMGIKLGVSFDLTPPEKAGIKSIR